MESQGLSSFGFIRAGMAQIRKAEGVPIVSVDLRAVLFEEAVDSLLKDKQARHLKPGSLANWSRAIQRAMPHLRGRLLAAIGPVEIHAAFLGVLKENGSPWMLNATREALGELFRWAVEMGAAAKSPISPRSWRHQKTRVKRVKHIFTEEEERQILEALPPAVGRVFLFSLNTALRLGDLRIARREWLRPDWWLTFPPETRKNKEPHSIFLNEKARTCITAEGPLLFPDMSRHNSTLARALLRAARKAGIQGEVCFTDCRRTLVSRMHHAGFPPVEVRKVLGWLSDEVYEEHYVHVPAGRAQSMLEEAGR